MLSFFPREVLDEILKLIESVSEGFPAYSSKEKADFGLHCLFRRSARKLRVLTVDCIS